MMGFCIMLYTVHITQEQGQGQVSIVLYCTHPGPCPCPVPGPVQCEWAISRWRLVTDKINMYKANCFRINISNELYNSPHDKLWLYKARHAHKRLYTVLPKYSKIQVLPGITSCRLVKYNKQAIELNSLLINNMPKDGYEWN